MQPLPNYPFPNQSLGSLRPDYPAVRKRPRAIRVMLNSADRIGGTLQAPQFKLHLPSAFDAKRVYVTMVRFMMAQEPNTYANVELYPTFVGIRELRDPNSWSSMTGQPHGILGFIGTSHQLSNNFMPSGEFGAAVADRGMFDRPITVELTSSYYDVTAADGVSNDWSIELSIWDNGEDY